eukprot:TRINITY_DN17218_c0_g1_i1.p2 TRINITY_DN17218_c0_g1~~TRINITY_DN17218_c0_g1_i1.p2  ORF type:complete len:140 (-),score=41.55 TRINITY_DN17218_c0_g1_i1:431-850(-)
MLEFFFFKQKTAYEMQRGLVGSEMCIRDSPNKQMVEEIVGIDIGNSYMRVARINSGKPEIIPNEDGVRETPSWIAFTESEVFIGENARAQAYRNPERTVFDIIQILSVPFLEQKEYPFKLIEEDSKIMLEISTTKKNHC